MNADLLYVFLYGMIPIGELRLAIPLGISVLDLPWYSVYPVAILGNIVPPIIIIPFLRLMDRYTQYVPQPLGKLLNWQKRRIRRLHTDRFSRYGAFALVSFVAIPLPLTGAWTGSLAAYLYEVPLRRYVILIGLGLIISGIIVSALVLSGLEIAGVIGNPPQV